MARAGASFRPARHRGRRYPAPAWRRLSSRPCRTSGAGRAARDERDRGVPNRGARRPRRGLRRLRRDARRLQLLPQSALSEVSGASASAMAGRRDKPNCCRFPISTSSSRCPRRSPPSPSRTRPSSMRSCSRAAAEAMTTLAANPRRLGAQDRRRRRPAHLGAGADASSPRPLRRAGRRPVARWHALDRRATELLSGRQAALPAVPPPVPRTPASRLRRRRLALLRRSRTIWPIPPPSLRIWPPCGASTGSSTPRGRSADPRRFSPISAATPIASPSPTAASSRLDDDHVAFTWKDYRQNGAPKIMKLEARRVHPPLPASRLARRLPSHPPLRLPGQWPSRRQSSPSAARS